MATQNTHRVNTQSDKAENQPVLDSFWKIAEHHRVSFQQLKLLNKGKGSNNGRTTYEQRQPPYSLFDGDVLQLPPPVTTDKNKKAGDAIEQCPRAKLMTAVLPIRYAIAKVDDVAVMPFASDSQQLDQTFPTLKSARYVLRTLRDGLVYLYIEGQIEIYRHQKGRLSRFNDNDAVDSSSQAAITRSAGRYLLLPENKTVYMTYSEHQWSNKQCQQIINNIDGARDRQMQRLTTNGNPQHSTLPITSITQQVVDFNSQDERFYWSDCPTDGPLNAAAVEQRMQQHKYQHIVSLHDPLGIVHDFSALLEEQLGALQKYTTTAEPGDKPGEERYRKKIISDIIEGLYRSGFNDEQNRQAAKTQNREITSPEQLAQLRQQHHQANDVKINKRQPRKTASFVHEVLIDEAVNPQGYKISRFIDEDKRRTFAEDYKKQVQQFQTRLFTIKQDRYLWLAQWQSTDTPGQLGTVWSSYDMSDIDDWNLFGVSFTRATTLIAGCGLPVSLNNQDKEPLLFQEWIELDANTPLHLALSGYTELRAALKQIRLNPQIREQVKNENSYFPQPVNIWDRNAQELEGTGNLIDDIFHKFPIVGTVQEEIIQSITVVNLANPKLRGHPMNQINQTLDDIVSNQNVELLWKTLSTRGGYYEMAIEDIAPDSVISFIKGSAQDMGIPDLQTGFSSEGIVGLKKPVINGQTATRAVNHVRVFRIKEKLSHSYKDAVIGDKYKNPFNGYVASGVSSFVIFLTLVNLGNAISSYNKKQAVESFSNLLAASMALGSGTNSLLYSLKVTMPELHSKIIANKFGERLAGTFGLKLFGYGGAIISAFTDTIRAEKRFNAGDNDAGSMYALSAVTILFGGSAITKAGLMTMAADSAVAVAAGTATVIPIAGFLIAGIILIGVSIWATTQAIDNTDGPLEHWLDAGIFGLQQLPDNPPYPDLAEEQQAYIQNMLHPQILTRQFIRRSVNRGRGHYYIALIEIYLPSFSRHSQLQLTYNYSGNRTTESNSQTKTLEPEQLTAHLQGVKAEYRLRLGATPPSEFQFTINYQARPNYYKMITKTCTIQR